MGFLRGLLPLLLLSGCLSNTYVIPQSELEHLANMPAEERWKAVRAVQSLGRSEDPPEGVPAEVPSVVEGSSLGEKPREGSTTFAPASEATAMVEGDRRSEVRVDAHADGDGVRSSRTDAVESEHERYGWRDEGTRWQSQREPWGVPWWFVGSEHDHGRRGPYREPSRTPSSRRVHVAQPSVNDAGNRGERGPAGGKGAQGKSSTKDGTSGNQGGGGAADAAVVAAAVVVVVGAVAGVGMVLSEGLRYDGWLAVHPDEVLYLRTSDGGLSTVPLSSLTPDMAYRARDAKLFEGSEPRFERLGRAPLDRSGFTLTTAFHGSSVANVDQSIGSAFGGYLHLGGNIGNKLTLGLAVTSVSGSDLGRSVQLATVAPEVQYFPLSWGGFYGGGGVAFRNGAVESRTQSDTGWFLRSGLVGEIPLTTHLAVQARLGAAHYTFRDDGSLAVEALVGFSVY